MGLDAEVRDQIGPGTRVVELDGQTLLPGFQDAHVHPIDGGLLGDLVDLHPLPGVTAYIAAIARYAAVQSDRAWIVGGGWSLPAFPRGEPGRELLDRVVPDRPAILDSDDGHVAWVNSRAIEIAGITAATDDPPGGRITRDANGEPAGALVDQAIGLVARHVPPPSHDDLVDGPAAGPGRAASARDHRLAGCERRTRAARRLPRSGIGRMADRAGRCRAVVAARCRARADRRASRRSEHRSRRPWAGCERPASSSCSTGSSRRARRFMTSPYAGGDGGTGAPFIDPELLVEAVTELDRRGFQAHFHAIGDGATRLALDAVAAARDGNGALRRAAPHRPSRGGQPGRHRTLRRAGRGGQHPAVLGIG